MKVLAQDLARGQQIIIGQYELSIGLIDSREVAIFHKRTGLIVDIAKSKSRKIKAIAKEHKYFLQSGTEMYFSHVSTERLQSIIDTLQSQPINKPTMLTHNQLQTLESALLAWSNKMPYNEEVNQELLTIAKHHKLDDLANILEGTIEIITIINS